MDYRAFHEPAYRHLKQNGAVGYTPENLESRIRFFAPGSMEGRHCLVLGCGNGLLAVELARRGAIVTGLDLSETAIEWAQEIAARAGVPSIRFQVGNALELPFDDQTFDLVVDDYCFHCIVGEDRARFLSECRRALKAGGFLTSITMCGDPVDLRRQGIDFDPASRTYQVRGAPIRHLGTRDSILSELRQAGFTLQKERVEPRPHDRAWDALCLTAEKP